MSDALSYSDYVAIVYASLQTCGVLSTSFYVLLKSSSTGCFERLKEIWSYKWIYISTLSTIYDQATDIGVLIYWHSLIDNNDIKHVDMTLLFVLSCIFCIISRLFNSGLGILLVKSKLLGLFLGLFDLMIMACVWDKITGVSNILDPNQMREDQDELSWILLLQTCEIFFESLPQILLQSLFLIRTFNNQTIYDDNYKNNQLQFDIFLVWISLFISVISATNKISNDAITRGGKTSQRNKIENKYNFRRKCPIINIGVLSQKIFFISTIITRLFICSLLWSVVGGLFLSLFVFICFIVFVIFVKCSVNDGTDTGLRNDKEPLWRIFLAFLTFESFGFNFITRTRNDHDNGNDNGNDNNTDSNSNSNIIINDVWHASRTPKRFLIHNILNFLGLLLILYFAIDDNFDCDNNICPDSTIRSFNHNRFVFVLFIIIFLTFILQIILFVSIPTLKKLSQKWEENYQSRKTTAKNGNFAVGTMVTVSVSPSPQ